MYHVFFTEARLDNYISGPCSIPPKEFGCKTCQNKTNSGYTGQPNSNMGPASRSGTGEPILHSDDLPGATGFGMPWGHVRSFSGQLSNDFNLGNGTNWQTSQWPHLSLKFDGTVYNKGAAESQVFRDADETLIFPQQSDGSYLGDFQTKETLTYDPGSEVYRHKQLDGSVTEYLGLNGMVGTHTDSRGNQVQVTQWAANGFQIRKVERTSGSDSEVYDYVYDDETSHNPHLLSVTLSHGGSPVSKVTYTYCSDGEFGLPDDLRTATTEIFQGGGLVSSGTSYYRYYGGSDPMPSSSGSSTSGSGADIPHLVKYALNPGSFERLSAVTNPYTASDSVVAMYADYAYQYNSDRQVTRVTLQSGSQTYEYDYQESGFSDDYNHWHMKTTETRPDGNLNITYSNYAGQTMLQVLKAGSDMWCNFTKYDTNGRAVLFANPSAVNGYDEALPDLLGLSGSTYTYLNDNSGLIRAVTYHDPSGYVASEGLQEGQLGSLILLRELDYCCATGDCECGGGSSSSSAAGGGSVCPSGVWMVASETVYPSDSDPDLTQVTSYCRTFYPDFFAVQELITTFPAVSTEQNGSGIAATRRDYFDQTGNLTWAMDERGFLTRTSYDIPTGAVTKLVQDADSTLYPDAPAGWSTPADGGLNLVSDFEVDALGRTTQSLGPQFVDDTGTTVRTASWSIYHDDSHITLSATGYINLSGHAKLVNPVSVTMTDASGRVNEQIQAASSLTNDTLPNILATYASNPRCGTDPTFGSPPLCGFSQSSYVRWTRYQYTDCCLAASQQVYHTIPATGAGSAGTNYDETDFGYDVMKRRNHTVTPGGTITDLVYDVRGNVIATYVGTNNDGATETDPTGGGADPDNNMVLVTTNQIDFGLDGGDGNVTQITQYVDSSTTRVTCQIFDFRDRRIAIDGEIDFYQQVTYDNLNRVIQTDRYDTVGPAGGCGGGSLSSSSAGPGIGNLIARSQTFFDARGNVYQTIVFAVDPTTGDVGNALTSNSWFDASNNQVKSLPAGSNLFTKTTFDSLGRAAIQYNGYNLTDNSYAGAFVVTSDVILQQVETTFDGASHGVQTTIRQRYHNAPNTQLGALQDPNTNPKARVTYATVWLDGAGRSIASADYGTNGGTSLLRPNTVPAPSDTVLVSTVSYDSSGLVQTTVDPAGMATCFEYDGIGRKITVIENCASGSSSSSSSLSSSSLDGCAPSDDQNVTTQYTYTADGQQATMTAINAKTSDQTTTWTYGTTLSESGIASSLLLASVAYPDSVSGSDVISYTYNRQGEQVTLTDQRGCVHSYDRDLLSRLIHDRVTTLGTGVDDAVLRLSTSYEVRGLPEKLTSYDNATVGSGSVVNQVQLAYNSFSQLVTDYQEHGGAVNTSTTPNVQFAYADGSTNTIRPTSMTYPNGRVLTYGYSGINDAISRIGSLIDNDGTTHLADYSYLGLGLAVTVDHPESSVEYILASLTGTSDPDTGDIYTGLDRFGRIKDCRHYDYGHTVDVARLTYGYDRASNRLWKADPVAQSNSKNLDELYSYDGVHRLKNMQRGLLSGDHTLINSSNFAQCWTLDSTNNWTGFREANSGGSWSTVQSRTSNTVNEITDITTSVGSAWDTPAYDAAGNTTTIPKPYSPTSGYTATYDAWNRLKRLSVGFTNVQNNFYDARNFRTIRDDYSGLGVVTRRHFYYTPGWRSIEERLGSAPDSADPYCQQVWGLRYIDDLVLRDRDTIGGGTLDERLYGCQDANWNMVALFNTSATVQERYLYSPFGWPTFMDGSFSTSGAPDIDSEILFTGQRFDSQTGLHLFRMRFLDSLTGRFVSRDPLGYPDGPNQYAADFVGNGLDPMGLKEIAKKLPSGEFRINYTVSESHPGSQMNENIEFTITFTHTPLPLGTRPVRPCTVDLIQVVGVYDVASGKPVDPTVYFDSSHAGYISSAAGDVGKFVDIRPAAKNAPTPRTPFYSDYIEAQAYAGKKGIFDPSTGKWSDAVLKDRAGLGKESPRKNVKYDFETCAVCREDCSRDIVNCCVQRILD